MATQTGAAGNPSTATSGAQPGFEICTVLETGNVAYGGAATTNGLVRVGSDTGGSVKSGCN